MARYSHGEVRVKSAAGEAEFKPFRYHNTAFDEWMTYPVEVEDRENETRIRYYDAESRTERVSSFPKGTVSLDVPHNDDRVYDRILDSEPTPEEIGKKKFIGKVMWTTALVVAPVLAFAVYKFGYDIYEPARTFTPLGQKGLHEQKMIAGGLLAALTYGVIFLPARLGAEVASWLLPNNDEKAGEDKPDEDKDGSSWKDFLSGLTFGLYSNSAKGP